MSDNHVQLLALFMSAPLHPLFPTPLLLKCIINATLVQISVDRENPPKPYCTMASEHVTVSIHAGSIEELRELARTCCYDFGCRPRAAATAEGDYFQHYSLSTNMTS